MGEDLIRISVGLEDVEDIIWDLDQALTYATGLNHAGERVGESSADKVVEVRRLPPLRLPGRCRRWGYCWRILLPAYYHSGGEVMTERRTWVGPSAPERLNILRNTRTIAIVGMSDKISRASYFVATYLQSASPFQAVFCEPDSGGEGASLCWVSRCTRRWGPAGGPGSGGDFPAS